MMKRQVKLDSILLCDAINEEYYRLIKHGHHIDDLEDFRLAMNYLNGKLDIDLYEDTIHRYEMLDAVVNDFKQTCKDYGVLN